RRPSWRLPAISNEVAMALKPFPPITAVLVFIFQSVEAFNNSVGTSVSTTIMANGMTALLIGLTAVSISMRIKRARHRAAENATTTEVKSTFAGLLQIAMTLVGIAILVSLVIGYVTFGRFLSYELVWFNIVVGSFYLLSHLVNDFCETLLSTSNPTGKRIQNLLNLDERHLQQAASLLAALCKTV
ncbi:DUF3772 domain-containing protein, partial [Pantoea agglomerans]